jgi:hypothetical protein
MSVRQVSASICSRSVATAIRVARSCHQASPSACPVVCHAETCAGVNTSKNAACIASSDATD